MQVETLDLSQAVDDLVSFSLHKRLRVVQVIHNKISDTSHSMYVIIKCDNGRVYELGISDHNNHSHQYHLGHIVDSIIPRDILYDSMEHIGIEVPDINMLNGKNYYSILPCRPYDIDPKGMVGKKSSHLAFVSDCYQVRTARLLDDKQVLMIDYTSTNGQYHETREYVNYDPIQEGCRMDDIAAIYYLKRKYSIPQARYIYYHRGYRINPDDGSGDSFWFDKNKYRMSITTDIPQITIKI